MRLAIRAFSCLLLAQAVIGCSSTSTERPPQVSDDLTDGSVRTVISFNLPDDGGPSDGGTGEGGTREGGTSADAASGDATRSEAGSSSGDGSVSAGDAGIGDAALGAGDGPRSD